MERSDLEHIIRAAADILSVDELVIVGSQSILGRYPNAPSPLKTSMEADVYPLSDPDPDQTEIKLAGLMGEMSYFFKTFGIWVDPVTERTSTLPDGWKDRLVEVCNANTNGAVGWCLDPTDLAIAKHVAGRDKDIAFTETMGASWAGRRRGVP